MQSACETISQSLISGKPVKSDGTFSTPYHLPCPSRQFMMVMCGFDALTAEMRGREEIASKRSARVVGFTVGDSWLTIGGNEWFYHGMVLPCELVGSIGRKVDVVPDLKFFQARGG